MDISVRDNPDESRYEIHVDGELAGFSQYRRRDREVNLFHTKIEDGHEGAGLGGKLARGALDDVRAQRLSVRADCPFIAGWIECHPDPRDLVRPAAV